MISSIPIVAKMKGKVWESSSHRESNSEPTYISPSNRHQCVNTKPKKTEDSTLKDLYLAALGL